MKDHAAPLRVAKDFDREFPSGDRRATEVVLNLLRTEGLVQGRLSTYLRRFDLTLASFNVLMILRSADGPMCPHEIGDRLLVTRGTVTGLLDSLERRGLIRRDAHPEDRRMLHISITDDARALLEGLLPDHFLGEAEMLAPFTAREKEELVRLLGKLQNHLTV